MTELLTQAERRNILSREIARYTGQGYRVQAQTEYTAQLVKPKTFSILWAIVWFLLFGVGLLVYLIYYLAKSDKLVYIQVDEYGNVNTR